MQAPPMPEMIPAWVDGRLTPVEKLDVHRRGLRHPAVSVFVLVGGQMLIQQRAHGKYHSPGLWANACCTHPAWGPPWDAQALESPKACAQRRLSEELGLQGLDLQPLGRVDYCAPVGAGMIENEAAEIFLALCDSLPACQPNPAEVAALRLIGRQALMHAISETPQTFTSWFKIYLADHADRLLGASGWS